MTKFHINKHGVPASCKAKPGNCPLGGDEQHFNTEKEAQIEIDKMNEEKHGLLPGINKDRRIFYTEDNIKVKEGDIIYRNDYDDMYFHDKNNCFEHIKKEYYNDVLEGRDSDRIEDSIRQMEVEKKIVDRERKEASMESYRIETYKMLGEMGYSNPKEFRNEVRKAYWGESEGRLGKPWETIDNYLTDRVLNFEFHDEFDNYNYKQQIDKAKKQYYYNAKDNLNSEEISKDKTLNHARLTKLADEFNDYYETGIESAELLFQEKKEELIDENNYESTKKDFVEEMKSFIGDMKFINNY